MKLGQSTVMHPATCLQQPPSVYFFDNSPNPTVVAAAVSGLAVERLATTYLCGGIMLRQSKSVAAA